MKRKFLTIGIFFALLCGCLFAGCASADKTEGKLKVTYELEGGVYRNGSAVVQYYDYAEGGSNLIRAIGTDSKTAPERAGYKLEGWYRVRTESDGNVTYSEKWNFETDELSGEPITLYARWVKDTNHTFEIRYIDENDEDVVKGEVEVEAGESFEDNLSFARGVAVRSGYTVLGWVNKDGTPFDLTTRHPGGEEDVAVPVYVKYIKGQYSIVSTAQELKASTMRDIYLTADIDLGGAEFSFGDYRTHKLNGGEEGHKIYNFKLKCSLDKNGLTADFNDDSLKSVSASLFGSAYKTEVINVDFEFTVEIGTRYSGITGNIYLAPLSVAPENATFKNVSVNATYRIKELPSNLTEDRVVVAEDKGYLKEDANSTFENVRVSLKKESADPQ